MVELLSPAGNKDSFIAAVQNGADAVYMGLEKYNARKMAENFSLDEYIWCIKYAHIYGVKVYLTFNILMYDNEFEDALKMLSKLYENGLDAVILQDIGLSIKIKECMPDIQLHASTQMTVTSLKQIKILEGLGFSRVVLARELTVDEIRYIAKNTSIELEVFIHGALCVSYSGACLMSSMIGMRSGNRGKCAGTCRLKYDLYEKNRKVITGNLLSKKDIYGADHIQSLIDVGVKSFKIEGRGKTKEYIALVTKKYRGVIDNKNVSKQDEKELLQMFNRSSKSYGYLEKVEYKDSISYKTAKNTGLRLGEILDTNRNLVKIKLEEDLSMHDGVENTYSDNISSTIVTCIKDEKFKLINGDVKAGRVVWIGDFKVLPKVGEILNKTSSKKLIDGINYELSNVKRKVNIALNIELKKSQKVHISGLNVNANKEFDFYIDVLPEKAINKKLTENDIISSFSKTKSSYYNFIINNLEIESDIFLPVSSLNKIRNYITDKLSSLSVISRKSNNINNFGLEFNEYKIDNKAQNSLFIYSYDKTKLNEYNSSKADYVYVNISDVYRCGIDILDSIDKNVYIYIPNVVLKKLEEYIDKSIEDVLSNGKVKGILLGNIGYLDKINYWKEKYGLVIVMDYSLNINNVYSAKFYKERGADVITISPEFLDDNIYNISKVCKVERVTDLVTVMTSRFCPIRSFLGKCCCENKKYYLIDSYKNKYHIVSDSTDCIMKLVRNIPYEVKLENNYNVRKCSI